MSSAGGLSRRRVANTTSSSDDASGSTWHANGSTSNGPVLSHAGSAFEGGNKIAFDPRDLDHDREESRTGGKLPRLTIMEEILLLGLKDKHGYLSFWNDSISYALRGCILMELALRRRIALVKDVNRRKYPIGDRIVEVIDDRQTGETILDETFENDEGPRSETWNVMKIGYQLKQVRERLAKGLVDKGVLRTEKRNFLLFDMATHPVADIRSKDAIITRVVSLLTASTSTIPPSALDKEGTQCRAMRAICLVYREAAFQRCDDILAEFSCWPFGSNSGQGSASGRRREAPRIGMGSTTPSGRESVLGLLQEVKREMNGEEDPGFELIAGVLEVLSKLDSLL
ncbi:Golgi phosphoprotein 3-domain-containing protein [Pisolithus marmoratus]|nr:Golgi phosphoprotein 3-domain-containing protein [Pisolithus marmoratus]